MTLFDDPDNPRWAQSGIADQLRRAAQREAIIEAVRSTARFICNADGVTFIREARPAIAGQIGPVDRFERRAFGWGKPF